MEKWSIMSATHSEHLEEIAFVNVGIAATWLSDAHLSFTLLANHHQGWSSAIPLQHCRYLALHTLMDSTHLRNMSRRRKHLCACCAMAQLESDVGGSTDLRAGGRAGGCPRWERCWYYVGLTSGMATTYVLGLIQLHVG